MKAPFVHCISQRRFHESVPGLSDGLSICVYERKKGGGKRSVRPGRDTGGINKKGTTDKFHVLGTCMVIAH